MYDDFWEHLKPGSSPVDWCESNYIITPQIAEFYNTFSNILFLVGPPVLIYLFKEYGKLVHPFIHVVWTLLIVVGLSSAYFHATLSLAGQLLDELTILWVFFSTFAVFVPKRYLPKIFKNRRRFYVFMFFFTLASTFMSFYRPAANAFAMMFLTIPTVYLLCHELIQIKEQEKKVYNLGFRTVAVLVIAVICWISDRMFCPFYSSIKFPYLHGFWHILIFLASYSICVLFAYIYVRDELPECAPKLTYWPLINFELGIPYISVKRPKDLKDQI
jgi:alkaline ceramidase